MLRYLYLTDLLTRLYFNATARSPPWIIARAWPSFPSRPIGNRLRHLTSAKTRQCDALYVNSSDRTSWIHLLLLTIEETYRRIISGIRNGKRNDGHVYFFLRFNVYTRTLFVRNKSKETRRHCSVVEKTWDKRRNLRGSQWTKVVEKYARKYT